MVWVFRNGIRFVWQIGLHGEEHAQGAVEHAVEAGLVAIEERQGGGRSQFEEGVGEGLAAGLTALATHAVGEELIFDDPGTAETPIGGGHLLDHAEFELIGGSESLQIIRESCLEAIRRFVREDNALGGEQAVLECILRDAAFTFGSDRAAGASAVGARGLDATE